MVSGYFFQNGPDNSVDIVSVDTIQHATLQILLALFKKAKVQGQGQYLLRKYHSNGTEIDLAYGSLYEGKALGKDTLKVIDSELSKELQEWELRLKEENADNEELVFFSRRGHRSFLGVRCQDGMLLGAYHDTLSSKSRTGLYMLMDAIYIAASYYMNTDDILRKAKAQMITREDLPQFNAQLVSSEIRKFIANNPAENGKTPRS
jgi:hypothetical protein